MNFLSYTDFIGKFALHTGMYDQSKLTDYIVRYEKKYLVELFGVALYNEFMSDIDWTLKTPKSPNFISIFNEFQVEIGINSVVQSNGIKDMLKGFIYFEYAKDLTNQMTPFGNAVQSSENSKIVTPLYSMFYNRYNESVRTLQAIQNYIRENWNIEIGQVVNMTNLLTGNGFYSSGLVWTNAPIVFNKSVKKFTLLTTGIGYSGNTTNVAVTGGSGNGMTVSFSITGGASQIVNVATLEIVNRGTGYTANDVVSITGTSFTTAAALIINEVYPIGGGTGLITTNETWLSGAINASNITNAGTGYAVGDLIGTFVTSGAVGNGAIIEVLSVSNLGAVLTYKFSNNGSGYALGSSLQSNAGIGSGTFAIFVTTVYIGQIKSVILSNIGQDFIIGSVIGIPNPNGILPPQYNASNPNFNLYTITYIGKGNFKEYRGKNLYYAYWL